MYHYEKLIRDAVDNGIRQRELAREIGVPTQTLNDWLIMGKKPHLKNLIRISEWSKRPLPALLVDIDNNRTAERMILLMSYLTPDQLQQIVNQMEQMIPDDVDEM